MIGKLALYSINFENCPGKMSPKMAQKEVVVLVHFLDVYTEIFALRKSDEFAGLSRVELLKLKR